MLAVLALGAKYFGGAGLDNQPSKQSHTNLGGGFELREIELLDANGDVIKNDVKYSNLYRDGLKVCETVFRQGGLSRGFVDGYCALIAYAKQPHVDKKRTHYIREYFNFGDHCIINTSGEIVLSAKNSLSNPSHVCGNVGCLDTGLYDLRTGEQFATTGRSMIIGKKYIVLDHAYSHSGHDKFMPTGVYQIDTETCETVKIDDIKK